MRKFFLTLFLISLPVIVLLALTHTDQRDVFLSAASWEIKTNLIALYLSVALAILCLLLVMRIIKSTYLLPNRIERWSDQVKKKRDEKAFEQLVSAYLCGDIKAHKSALKTLRSSASGHWMIDVASALNESSVENDCFHCFERSRYPGLSHRAHYLILCYIASHTGKHEKLISLCKSNTLKNIERQIADYWVFAIEQTKRWAELPELISTVSASCFSQETKSKVNNIAVAFINGQQDPSVFCSLSLPGFVRECDQVQIALASIEFSHGCPDKAIAGLQSHINNTFSQDAIACYHKLVMAHTTDHLKQYERWLSKDSDNPVLLSLCALAAERKQLFGKSAHYQQQLRALSRS